MNTSEDIYKKYNISKDEIDFIIKEVRENHNTLAAIATIRKTYSTTKQEAIALFKDWVEIQEAKYKIKETIS